MLFILLRIASTSTAFFSRSHIITTQHNRYYSLTTATMSDTPYDSHWEDNMSDTSSQANGQLPFDPDRERRLRDRPHIAVLALDRPKFENELDYADSELFQLLRLRTNLDVCFSESDFRTTLAGTPRPRALLVVDKELALENRKELLLEVKQYVDNGGIVIFMAMNFAQGISTGQMDDLFRTFGLRWACEGREWSTYAENHHNRHVWDEFLPYEFTQEALLLKNVSHPNALYLKKVHVEADLEDDERERDEPQDKEREDAERDDDGGGGQYGPGGRLRSGLVSTPAALAKVGQGSGKVGFVGNDRDDRALVNLVFQICGLGFPGPCRELDEYGGEFVCGYCDDTHYA